MGSNDVSAAAYESVWLDANRFYDAERRYYEISETELCKRANPGHSPPHPKGTEMHIVEVEITASEEKELKKNLMGMLQSSSLASEIAYARQKIQNFLKSGDSGIDINSGSLVNRLEKVEKEQEIMKKQIETLTSNMADVLSQLTVIKNYMKQGNNPVKGNTQVAKKEDKGSIQNGSPARADDGDDDDLDLFGSDEENEDAVKLREERLQAYANKKAKKPALVAKSSVVLDVKPWDDETDMKAMEDAVRAIETDGLVWGASKLVPLAYGIKKLQIVAIVEDEKVSVDWLQETISEVEDLVQSVDIAAFNKL